MIDAKGMIGRKIESVARDVDGADLCITFADGYKRRFVVFGDCCSTSWIEHLEMPNDVKGATLLSFEDSAPITQDHDEHDQENGGDCIQVYNSVFHTDRGDIVVEYRNSSNGYYGGSLEDLP